tara:strand:- start:1164 stop:2645 length:1482 start_codon:yes stop_codon:yes gene_type:complete
MYKRVATSRMVAENRAADENAASSANTDPESGRVAANVKPLKYNTQQWGSWYFGVSIVFCSILACILISYFAWDMQPGYSIIWGCAVLGAGLYFSYKIMWAAWEDVKAVENASPGQIKATWRESLWKWNVACAVFHTGSAAAIAGLMRGTDPWPVKGSIRRFVWEPIAPEDAGKSCRDVKCMVRVMTEQVGSIHMEAIVLSFHALSSLAHVIVVIDMWISYRRNTDGIYMSLLDKKMNPLRWAEYFFSASLMQVVVQILCGYTDVWILSLCATCIAVTQVFGYASEAQASKALRSNLGFDDFDLYKTLLFEGSILIVAGAVLYGLYGGGTVALLVLGIAEVVWAWRAWINDTKWEPEKWLYYIAGWVSFSCPWVAVYYSFYDAIGLSNPGPPDWVKVIVWSLVLLFGGFAVVMGYYLYNYTDPEVTFKSEFAYLILSFVSKAALAWQLYYGLVQRESRNLKGPDPTAQYKNQDVLLQYLTNETRALICNASGS